MTDEKVVSEVVEKPVDEIAKEKLGEVCVKPLSENGFVKFWQKVWRAVLAWWCNFENKHPKLAKFLLQFVVFWLISNLVTIFQMIIVAFLPYAFGLEMATGDFAWPGTIYHIGDHELHFVIFGYPEVRNAANEVIIGGGAGYFWSWLIATFLAQCINFPMQRNITYHSHGNPYWQALWYLIGWAGINTVIWIIIGNIAEWNTAFVHIPPGLMAIINMLIQGGVAMLIFYFIFKVIFPDLNVQAAGLAKQLEVAKENGASAEKIAKLEEKYAEISQMAEISNADKAKFQATRISDGKALSWDSAVKALEKRKAQKAPEKEEKKVKWEAQLVALEESIPVKYKEAQVAAGVKEDAEKAYADVLAKYNVVK